MNHIIYLHGFGSSPNSTKVAALAKHFNVFAPNVPYTFDIDFLDHQIKKFLLTTNVGDKVYFCGTSLGGFFAAYLSNRYDSKALVINPSVDPYSDLQKYIGPNINFNTGEPFLLTKEEVDTFNGITLNPENVTAIICTKDEIVDSLKSREVFKDAELIDSSDHQFNDINKIVVTLQKMFDSAECDNLSEGDF